MRRRAVVTFLLAAQLGALFVATAPPAAAALPPSEWVIGPSEKVAFLTFSGLPRERHLEYLMKKLDRKNADATFFVPGRWIAAHKAIVRKMVDDGHVFGNAGWRGKPFTRMSNGGIARSLERAREVLNSVGSHPRPLARPPDGKRDLRVLNVLGGRGYRSVRWTHRARGDRPWAVAHDVVRNLQKGSIVSLNIRALNQRRATGPIVKSLRRRGYRVRDAAALTNAHAVRWDVTLRPGSTGPEVSYLTKRLRATSYAAGPTDGSFGYQELQAVYAFEKVYGWARDGVVTPAQMTKIAKTPRPKTPRPRAGNPADYIDVDISRQVMFEVKNRRVRHTVAVSTGNGETYYSDGQQKVARTPRGNFWIERKIAGERHGSLGTLYWPSYFYGGYAIHGSNSVPPYPASHGCVRIPRYLERKVYYREPIGTPVFVHD